MRFYMRLIGAFFMIFYLANSDNFCGKIIKKKQVAQNLSTTKIFQIFLPKFLELQKKTILFSIH